MSVISVTDRSDCLPLEHADSDMDDETLYR